MKFKDPSAVYKWIFGIWRTTFVLSLLSTGCKDKSLWRYPNSTKSLYKSSKSALSSISSEWKAYSIRTSLRKRWSWRTTSLSRKWNKSLLNKMIKTTSFKTMQCRMWSKWSMRVLMNTNKNLANRWAINQNIRSIKTLILWTLKTH